VEQCSAQTKAVIQAEGLQAVGDSFQELGQITGEEILKNPERAVARRTALCGFE
jgi:hypothetical protein